VDTDTPTPEPSRPVAPSTSGPDAAPVTEPVAAPVTEPVAAPATEPFAAPATEPFAEPTTEPLSTANSEPVAAPSAEPVVAPTAEPATVASAAVPATPGPAAVPQVVGQVLPIYFVGDESHSMAGDPIQAVNRGLADLRDEVAKHPLIGKKVRFGIITFAHSAETRLELSELTEDLLLPTLSPRGRGTSYASAFDALHQTIPGDIALLKSGGYQVHRPAVFFLTDGQPTDREKKWQARLSELKSDGFRERPNIMAFGVGDADPAVIRQIASAPRYAFMMVDGASTAGAISEFATSMLNSMVASAEQLDRGERTIEFEKPEGFIQLDAPLL
jgi:uncharacterized protein YegL